MTQVRNLQEENRQLNEQLNSIRTANRNQQQQQSQIATKKETRMSIVGDSNARNIYHQLRRLCPEEMEISLTEAFTTQQLEQRAENISDQEEFKDTRVHIHAGTNDLRHGGKATECMDSLKYVSHMLETLEIEHFLVQIPPSQQWLQRRPRIHHKTGNKTQHGPENRKEQHHQHRRTGRNTKLDREWWNPPDSRG